MRLLGPALVAVPRIAAALCECGFSATGPQGNETWLFTDTLESDFTRVADVSRLTSWVPQQFDVSQRAGRGKYGKRFSPSNVVSHPGTKDGRQDRAQADPAGIELRVDSTVTDGAIAGAEMDSATVDMHYGSYRAGMRLTAVHGTCAAFFWYFNDTQEIDMEFLSQDYNHGKQLYPVNLVIQSLKSAEAGYDASRTDSFKRVNLEFDPTDGFHEYRFDYLPGRVVFYADSTKLAEMQGHEMPSSAGHLILQHWSNGDAKWSGGPPSQDALLTVSYVKAYFNTTSRERSTGWARRCAEAKGEAVCSITNVVASNASTGGGFLTDEGSRGPGKGDEESEGHALRVEDRGGLLLAAVLTATAMVAVGGWRL